MGRYGGWRGGLLALARWRPAGRLLSLIVCYMSWMIPAERLRETETLLAFRHPRPSYPTHILLVPKRPWPDLAALETADTRFLADLFQTTQSLVDELKLAPGGYRLILNGGAYQDVGVLHFHLVAGEGKTSEG
jgi:histidine triad (HIT) family protein